MSLDAKNSNMEFKKITLFSKDKSSKKSIKASCNTVINKEQDQKLQ